MDKLKTRFNPLVPLFRTMGVCFGLSFVFFAIYIVFYINKNVRFEDYGMALFVLVLGLFTVYMFLKPILSETKTYLITEEYIEEFNFLTFKKKRILKEQIKGFSTSSIPYRGFTTKEVIIYLRDGKRIELIQHTYFNFRKIQPFLKAMNCRYYGFESYKWKPLNSRHYLFDKIDDWL